jgi:hypothetical protein
MRIAIIAGLLLSLSLTACGQPAKKVDAAAAIDMEVREHARATNTKSPLAAGLDAVSVGEDGGGDEGAAGAPAAQAGGAPPAAPLPSEVVVAVPVEKPAKDGSVRPVDSKGYTTRYDAHFVKYAKRFFGVGGMDWRWFKSQSIAESALKPDAVSWCGARGLMQLMPATEAEIRSQQRWIGDTRQEEWNIAAGVYYDSRMIALWDARLRNNNNLLAFMFASYNAGGGNIAYYQKRCIREGSPCGTCNDWCGIVPYSNKESIGYVTRIFALMGEKY